MTSLLTEDQLNIIECGQSVILRYVPHALIEEFEKTGWKVVNDMSNSHHGRYSVIMQKEDLSRNQNGS